MDVKNKLEVIDINSGLGGRVSSFINSDFNVLATIINKNDTFNYYNSQINNIPYIASDFSQESIADIPKSDVISANFSLPFSTFKSNINFYTFNSFLSQLILRDAPKAFIFQVPTTLLRSNKYSILETSVLRRYQISYQVFKEADYSGYSVSGNQAYIIGVRADVTNERFLFPAPQFYNTDKYKDFLPENAPERIDPWYRKLSNRIVVDFIPSIGKFYTRNFEGKLIETQKIHMFTRNECYYCDEIGLRKLTHNEYAYLKGFTEFNYNNCTNRYDMYRKIFTEPNLYIFKDIASELYRILTNSTSDFNPLDWPSSTRPKSEKTSRKKESKTKTNIKEEIVQPRNKILNIHIDKLKGLKELDININKNLTAIMGVNGVGKSTILHALACVFSPYTSNGQNQKFNFFFTPNPDALWNDSKFSITYLDENTQKENVRNYQKKIDRWSPQYNQRPIRDVFYVGIDTCLPEIEKERQTSYITYSTDTANDKLSERIIKSAAYILEKDYKELTYNKTKKKNLVGLRTSTGVNYSSLSMGAGEQRLIEILKLVYSVERYSLILIDEIDLLLHAKALERLIKTISEIAIRKNLQIIFTTHSLVMRKLEEFVDIRYLYQTKEKTMVLTSMTPDIVFDISDESEMPLTIYVEDDLAQTIITHILKALSLSKYTSIKTFGAAENAFTLAAGFVLDNTSIENKLIVIDGDVYRTEDEKKIQIKKKLSGTEENHEDKLDCALNLITQFVLPDDVFPEKFIYDMLIDLNNYDEITEYAKQINSVTDSHDWLNIIIKRINQERNITLYQIIDNVNEHENWENYIKNVREWLIEKKNVLNLK